MKEQLEEMNRTRRMEYSLVIIVVMVMFIILSPTIFKIISNSMYNTAKLNTQGTIDTIKEIYASSNITQEVGLPFTMKYKRGKFTMYENGVEFTMPETADVEISGKQASSGSVTITTKGEIVVKDLKFGLYACSKKAGENLDCYFKL